MSIKRDLRLLDRALARNSSGGEYAERVGHPKRMTNPTHESWYPQPTGDRIVKVGRIIGTDHLVFDVWEPSSVMGPHSSITTIGGRWYGRLGSRRPPPTIEALPGYREPGHEHRRDAVRRWYGAQYDDAYRLILARYPELMGMGAHRSDGEIALTDKGLADRLDPRTPGARS